MSEDNTNKLTKEEIDIELKKQFKILQKTNPRDTLIIRGIKEKITILKSMKETISE